MNESDDQALLSATVELLQAEHTAGVATVTDHGVPWASNLYYAPLAQPTLRLVVRTDSASAHAGHWQERPQVAVTVFAHPDRPRERVRGVQLSGLCRLSDPSEQQAYLARFPESGEAGTGGGQTHYTIAVTWLRLLDRATGISQQAVIDPSAG